MPSTVEKAMSTALRLLTGRSLSRAELERRLRQRRFDTAAIAEAIDTCGRCGYIDDLRTARERASTLVRRGYGPRRIREALSRLGLEEAQVEAIIEEQLPPSEEALLARRLLIKKSVRRRGEEDPHRRKAREYRFLLQRGFSPEVTAHLIAANEE